MLVEAALCIVAGRQTYAELTIEAATPPRAGANEAHMSNATRKAGKVVNAKPSAKPARRARHSTTRERLKPSNASVEAKRSSASKPSPLDEESSARVVAELLVLGDIETREIESILHTAHAASFRQIALTFRISDVLGVPAAFELAPRFRAALESIRSLLRAATTDHHGRCTSEIGIGIQS